MENDLDHSSFVTYIPNCSFRLCFSLPPSLVQAYSYTSTSYSGDIKDSSGKLLQKAYLELIFRVETIQALSDRPLSTINSILYPFTKTLFPRIEAKPFFFAYY